MNKVKVLRVLGSGSFGTAILIQNPRRKVPTVLKIIRIEDEKKIRAFKAEIQIAKQIGEEIEKRSTGSVLAVYDEGVFIDRKGSPNIIINGKGESSLWTDAIRMSIATIDNKTKTKNYTNDNDEQQYAWFEMEYADGGPLLNYVSKEKLNVKQIREIVFQLTWTLAVTQAGHGLRHFDLKADNISILNRNNNKKSHDFKETYRWIFKSQPRTWKLDGNPAIRPVVLDFGLSSIGYTTREGARRVRPVGVYTSHVAGTPHTADPLALMSKRPTSSTPARRGFYPDIWALGVLVLQMGLINTRAPSNWNCVGWPAGTLWKADMHPIEIVVLEGSRNYFKRQFKLLFKNLMDETKSVSWVIGSSIGVCMIARSAGVNLFDDIDPYYPFNEKFIKYPTIGAALFQEQDQFRLYTSVSVNKNNITDRVSLSDMIIDLFRINLGDTALDFVRCCFSGSFKTCKEALLHPYFSCLEHHKTPTTTSWYYHQDERPFVKIEFEKMERQQRCLPLNNKNDSGKKTVVTCFVCGLCAEGMCSKCEVYTFCSQKHATLCPHPTCSQIMSAKQ